MNMPDLMADFADNIEVRHAPSKTKGKVVVSDGSAPTTDLPLVQKTFKEDSAFNASAGKTIIQTASKPSVQTTTAARGGNDFRERLERRKQKPR